MEYDVIPALIGRGARIYIHSVDANTPFLDIGTPETVAQAEGFVSRHFALMKEEKRIAV
jgi:NDP-sugar pyrophosphorylase family protein